MSGEKPDIPDTGSCTGTGRIAAHKSGGLTALPRGNIARLHEIAHQGTIGEKETRLAGLQKAVTGLPQPFFARNK
jgi:hypothetical protein